MPVVGTLICNKEIAFNPPLSSVTACEINILSITPTACLVSGGGSGVHSVIIQLELINTSSTVDVTLEGLSQQFTGLGQGVQTITFASVPCTVPNRIINVTVADNADPTCNDTNSYITPIPIGAPVSWVQTSSAVAGNVTDCGLVASASGNGTPYSIRLELTNGVPSLQVGITTTGVYNYRYISGGTTLYIELNVTSVNPSTISFTATLHTVSGVSSFDSFFVDNTLANKTSC